MKHVIIFDGNSQYMAFNRYNDEVAMYFGSIGYFVTRIDVSTNPNRFLELMEIQWDIAFSWNGIGAMPKMDGVPEINVGVFYSVMADDPRVHSDRIKHLTQITWLYTEEDYKRFLPDSARLIPQVGMSPFRELSSTHNGRMLAAITIDQERLDLLIASDIPVDFYGNNPHNIDLSGINYCGTCNAYQTLSILDQYSYYFCPCYFPSGMHERMITATLFGVEPYIVTQKPKFSHIIKSYPAKDMSGLTIKNMMNVVMGKGGHV